MNVYFAHPINTYKTEIEDAALNIIKAELGDKVINPGDDFYQSTFAKYRLEHPDSYMDFFKDLVSKCDIVAYLPFRDKRIGAGAWFEAKEMMSRGCDGYEVDLEKGKLHKVDLAYIDSQKLTVEETRARIKTKY